jgi:hypothetical protein
MITYKPYRTQTNDNNQDSGSIISLEYSKYSGSQKVSEVGRRLIPLVYLVGSVSTYTTSAVTARVVNPGTNLAIYNNDTAIHSITLGTSSAVTVLAPGVTNATGGVGVPLPPSTWTYLATGTTNWLISDSALALVFVIQDDTIVTPEYFQNAVLHPNVDPS